MLYKVQTLTHECPGQLEMNSEIAFHSTDIIKNHFLVFALDTNIMTKLMTSCVVSLYIFMQLWELGKFRGVGSFAH